MSKRISIEEFTSRLENMFPNQPFEILEYNGVSNPGRYKCLVCNSEHKISAFRDMKRKQHLCLTCFPIKGDIIKKTKEDALRLLEKNNEHDFIDWEQDKNSRKYLIIYKCRQCSQIHKKPVYAYLKNPKCPYCGYGSYYINDIGFKARLSKEYEALEEYQGANTKIKFKHKCGFIWKATPHSILFDGVYCPQCSQRISKGERKIYDILTKKEINFERELTFSWSQGRRYDFYLPDYSLIIEFHGIQHYEDIPWRNDTTLAERQEIDNLKEFLANKNGYKYLIISYIDFKDINKILTNWFNDHPLEGVGSSDPKQKLSLLDNDMV